MHTHSLETSNSPGTTLTTRHLSNVHAKPGRGHCHKPGRCCACAQLNPAVHWCVVVHLHSPLPAQLPGQASQRCLSGVI